MFATGGCPKRYKYNMERLLFELKIFDTVIICWNTKQFWHLLRNYSTLRFIAITKIVSILFTEKYTVLMFMYHLLFNIHKLAPWILKLMISVSHTPVLQKYVELLDIWREVILAGNCVTPYLLPHSIISPCLKVNNFVQKTDLANNFCPFVKLDFQKCNRCYCFYPLLA